MAFIRAIPLEEAPVRPSYVKGHDMAITRQNIQPEALATPSRSGHTLYSHVVSVEGRRLIFVAGQLARDRAGNVVGKGDMRAQIRQVGENIKAALAAAGATLADIVKTNTFVTDMDEYFRHVDVRMEYFGPALPTSTTVEVGDSPTPTSWSRSKRSR